MSKESRAILRQRRIEQDWRTLHEKHVEQHERELQQFAERAAYELHDPRKAAELGLPEGLTEESIKALGNAMAYDKLGPKRPKADRYSDSLGNPPSVLHRFD